MLPVALNDLHVSPPGAPQPLAQPRNHLQLDLEADHSVVLARVGDSSSPDRPLERAGRDPCTIQYSLRRAKEQRAQGHGEHRGQPGRHRSWGRSRKPRSTTCPSTRTDTPLTTIRLGQRNELVLDVTTDTISPIRFSLMSIRSHRSTVAGGLYSRSKEDLLRSTASPE